MTTLFSIFVTKTALQLIWLPLKMTGLLSVFRIFVIYIISTNNAVLGGVISKYFLFQKKQYSQSNKTDVQSWKTDEIWSKICVGVKVGLIYSTQGICDCLQLNYFSWVIALFYLCSCVFDLYFKDFIGCVILHTSDKWGSPENTLHTAIFIANTLNFKNEKKIL